MITLRTVTHKLFRSFSIRRMTDDSGVRGRFSLGKIENLDIGAEDLEEEDLSQFESDFMDVHISHKKHVWEQHAATTQLKRQIVATQCFAERDPAFLTLIEQERIRSLHKEDPEEWTPEKLSESFPALPNVIRKILRKKWVPKTVERAVQYDNTIVENWNKFRSDQLPVSPALKKHLIKFKDRKIALTDRHLIAEQLVPSKYEFPKPRNTIFSSVVKGFIESEETFKKKEISSNENAGVKKSALPSVRKILKTSAIEQFALRKEKTERQTVMEKLALMERQPGEKTLMERSVTEEKDVEKPLMDNLALAKQEDVTETVAEWVHADNSNKEEEPVSLNDFARERLKELYESSPEKAITIMDIWRKKMKTKNSTTKQNRGDNSKQLVKEEEENVVLTTADYRLKAARFLREEPLTFNEFVKEKLPDILETEPEEGQVLLDTWRKQVESTNLEHEYSFNDSTSSTDKEVAMVEKPEMAVATAENESVTSEVALASTANNCSLDTYIKQWTEKIDKKFEYANRIKIPENVLKEGKTYRIVDCYYDDDGEFLYRVPGVWT